MNRITCWLLLGLIILLAALLFGVFIYALLFTGAAVIFLVIGVLSGGVSLIPGPGLITLAFAGPVLMFALIFAVFAFISWLLVLFLIWVINRLVIWFLGSGCPALMV
jgi:hypothetical protein